MEFLNPEFIVSTGAGGAVVWSAVKIHLHYMTKHLQRHDDEIKTLFAIVYNRRQTDEEMK
jgi:hypothetical protein